MGYGTRNNGIIRTFTPDDTEDEFYIADGENLQTIVERMTEKWPDIGLFEVKIESKYIHTDCLDYDLYDAGDYTEYLCISRVK